MRQSGIFNAIVAALIIFLLFVFVPIHKAMADTPTVPSKYASIVDYGKSRWVQGMAMTNDGHYCYVWKQNGSKYCSMQRIDTKTKRHVRMTLGKNVARYVGHGNDLEWLWYKGKGYILAAPYATPNCRGGERYLVVLKVSGTKVTVYKRVRVNVCNKVSRVALRSVQGSKVSIFVGGGGRNQTYATAFDMGGNAAISGGTLVYGLSLSQGICSYKSAKDGNEYAYVFSGGYDTKVCTIRKYQVQYGGTSGMWFKCVSVRHSYGEWEDGAIRGGVLWVAVEGKSLKRKQFGDRLTRTAA